MMDSFVKTPESVGTEAVPVQEMGVEEDGGGGTGVSQGLKRQREPLSSEEENVLSSQESIGDLKHRCPDPSGEESRDPELQEAESPVINSLSGAEREVLDTPTTSSVQSRRGVKSAGGAVSSGAPPAAQRCLSDPGLFGSDLHEEEDRAKSDLHSFGNAEFRLRVEQFESRQDGPPLFLSSPRPRVLSSFVRAAQQKLRSAETPSTSRTESIRQEREQELRLLRSQSISENPWLKRSFSDSFLAEFEPPVPAKVPRNAREQTALQDHGSATGPVPSEEVQCFILEPSPQLNDVGKFDKFQQEAESPADREQEGAESPGQHQQEVETPTGQKQEEAESRTGQKQAEAGSPTSQKQQEVESCTCQKQAEAESPTSQKQQEVESCTCQKEVESSIGQKQEEAESRTGQKQDEAESRTGQKQDEAESRTGQKQDEAESRTGQKQDEAESRTGQKQDEAESRTGQKQDEAESRTGQKQDEAESRTGQKQDEAESRTGQKQDEAESRTGQKQDEAESRTGQKQDEAESRTGQKQDEAESRTGQKQDEAESRTGQKQDEAESRTGQKQDEAESRTGQKQDEAESRTGQKQDEAESRTGQKQEEAESRTGQKQEEAESRTGQKQEEAESRTGQKQEEAESRTGQMQEEAESRTGQMQEEAESPTGQKQEEAESPTGQKQEEAGSRTGQKPEEAGSRTGQKPEEAGSPSGQKPEEAGSPSGQKPEEAGSPSGQKPEEAGSPSGQPRVLEGTSNGKQQQEETSASKPKKETLSNGSQEEVLSCLGEYEGLSNEVNHMGGSQDKPKTELPSEELGMTGSPDGSTYRTREEHAVGDLKNFTFDPVQDVIGGLESVTGELQRSTAGSELGSLEEELNTSEMIDRMFRGVLDMSDEEEEGGSSETELVDDGTGEGQEDDGPTQLDSSLEELSTIPPSFVLSPLGHSMEMVITSLRLSSNYLPDSLPLTPEEPSSPLLVDGSLPYSIDTYRTRRPVSLHAIKSSIAELRRPEPERSRPRPSVNTKERIAGLWEEAARLQEIITQTLQALSCCAERSPRIDSLAEAEAERLLLVSCEKRAALLAEVSRLRGGVSGDREFESAAPCPEPCRGTVSIRNLQLPLKVEFLCSAHARSAHARTGQPMHYFFVLVRYGACNIVATPLASTTDAQNGDTLAFPTSITLQDIRSSFQIDVEVYSLSSAVRSSSTEKCASKPKVTPKRLLNSITGIKRKTRSSTLPTVDPRRSSHFCLVGSHKITLSSLGQCKFPLDKVPFLSPLEGNIYLQLQCEGHSKVQRCGFLTMFEDVRGFATWQRRWFCLQGDSLSFWSYPSYQHCKPAEGVISLSCSNILSVRPVRRDLCTRPHTIELVSGGIEPQDCLRTRDKRWFSADTFEERTEWLDKLNQALLDLHTWSLTPATF